MPSLSLLWSLENLIGTSSQIGGVALGEGGMTTEVSGFAIGAMSISLSTVSLASCTTTLLKSMPGGITYNIFSFKYKATSDEGSPLAF
jgi:hypothetical protein